MARISVASSICPRHADIATTEIYTHVELERLTKLVTTHHPLARR